MEQCRDAVLEAGDVDEVDREPHQPGDDAGEPQLADHRDRAEAADDRHRALVEVVERLLRRLALDPAVDLLGGVLRTLDRDLRDAREVVEADHVADDEHLGVAGEGEVGVDADAAGAVERGAGLVGQRLGQRRGLHAGGPDLGDGVDALGAAVLELHLDAALVDVGHHRAEDHLDAELLQLGLGPLAELLAERRQDLRRGVEQDHARLARVDRPEVALERAVGELGDLAGHLDPGRAGADDDEGQVVVDVVASVGAELGHLEGSEDPAAELERVVDRLHAGRVLGEVVVAEVGLGGARGDHQRVVGRDRRAAEHLAGDLALLEVDGGDLAEQDLRVLLAAEDLTRRRRDLALGEDAGRHLVEQRLEEVVRGLGDHRDLDVGPPQRLGAEEAAEPGPDDHDPVPAAGATRRVAGVLARLLGVRHGSIVLLPAPVPETAPTDRPRSVRHTPLRE